MLFLFSFIYDFWIKKEIKEKTWPLPGISTIPRRKLIVNKQESTARGKDLGENPEWTQPDWDGPREEKGVGEGRAAADQEEQPGPRDQSRE